MSQMYVLDESGQPRKETDALTWGLWYESTKATQARTVAVDRIGDAKVSTVFLGLDHNYAADGDPVLWETMVFGGPHDERQERYTSRAEAEAGHGRIVAMLRSDLGGKEPG